MSRPNLFKWRLTESSLQGGASPAIKELARRKTGLRRARSVRHFGGDAPGAKASLSPDGGMLAIAGLGRDLVLADLKTGKERKLAGRELLIHQAIFVKDGTQVLAAARAPKEVLILYNVKGGAIKRLADTKNTIGWTFLALAPNKRQVLVGGTDKAAYVFDLDTGAQENRFPNFR